jgi:hypothetical protein
VKILAAQTIKKLKPKWPGEEQPEPGRGPRFFLQTATEVGILSLKKLE